MASEIDEIRQRDERASCVQPGCHQASADRRALIAELDQTLARLRTLEAENAALHDTLQERNSHARR